MSPHMAFVEIYQKLVEKGQPGGYAGLNLAGEVDSVHLPGSAARVRHSVLQTIPTATLTTVAFDTEDYDTAALHDTAIDNSRLVAPVAGVYAIGAEVQWAANVTGQRELQLRLNGNTEIAKEIAEPVSASGVQTRQSLSTDYVLNAGDYVEVRVRQGSGGNLDVLTGGSHPHFRMRYAGAAPGAPPSMQTEPMLHLADAQHQLRSSDCSTAFFRPDVPPKDIRNIDNGYLEGGVAISLSAKTYTGVRFAIVLNDMPITPPSGSPSADYIVDFRLCAWDYETKALLAVTDNLAAELNGLPREGNFDEELGYLLTADFLAPISLSQGERVILGTAMYGDYPCRNIANASVNAFKTLMGRDPQLGFNNKSVVVAATQPGEFPTGGYEGGTPGPVGTDVSGNYPWMDLIAEES